MPVTRIEKLSWGTVGKQTREVIRDRREIRREEEEKTEVKRRLELEMSDDHSDGEGSGGHEADPVDTTEDMEIKLNLPREVDEEQDRPREDIRKPPESIGPGEAALRQEEQHRFEPRTSKWPRHGLPLPSILEPIVQ